MKECIKTYRYNRSFNELKKDFNRHNKPVLQSTLEHLNVSDVANLNKPDIVQKLILRFQNLLPDQCEQCKQRYSVKVNDAHLLCCQICGQEVHRDCFINTFIPEDLRENLTPDKVVKVIDPLNIPGLHYVCRPCAISADIDIESQDNPAHNGLKTNVSGRKSTNNSSTPPSSEDTPTTEGNRAGNQNTNKKSVCRFHLRKKRKFGISG